MSETNYIKVSFEDEVPLLQAVKRLRENKEIIKDVMTPFPVHGLDEALSMKRTRIPVVGFIFGALGASLAFIFQTWVFTVSYPLIIGGKPFFSVPAFVPITFELTVLFSGLAMVAALMIRSRLKPEITFTPVDERITDDRFIILVDSPGDVTSLERIKSILSGIQSVEIK
jgi:hypothetical protein